VTRLVVISGCSGGGKSTLLAELARRGFVTVEEPGRRIVDEERAGTGAALPWVDLAAFARRAIAMARDDREWALTQSGPVFFDRGLVDAAAALEYATGEPALHAHADERYHSTMFMVPPWPALYETDDDRRHGLNEAVGEYDRLMTAYGKLGYDIRPLPQIAVGGRAQWLLDQLGIA
jgi:predicted ATPase